MDIKVKDSFGFFIADFSLKIGPYFIEPVKDHVSEVKRKLKLKHPDGFYYPIQVAKKKDISTGKFKKIPNSEKPAHLYALPATHVIYKKSNQPLSDDFRSKDGALLIHLLAVLYNCTAQFYDWQYDTRFSLKQDAIAVFTENELERLMNEVFDVFSTWTVENQNHYNNILYLHSRCPAYQWEWEQFIMEYMVADSLWRLFARLFSQKEVPHKIRIKTMCSFLHVHYDQDEVENRIVEFRNTLFHEGLWGEATPGYPQRNNDPFYANLFLRKLNHRLILALAGIRSDFTKKTWKTFDSCSLY